MVHARLHVFMHAAVIAGGHLLAARTGGFRLRWSGLLVGRWSLGGSGGLSPGHHGQGQQDCDEIAFHKKSLSGNLPARLAGMPHKVCDAHHRLLKMAAINALLSGCHRRKKVLGQMMNVRRKP
jgi:hypothetical protein